MSKILFRVTIFLLKLMVVVIWSPLLGCIGLVTAPLRFWQAITGQLKASAANLESSVKTSILAGTFFIFVASIAWVGLISEIVSTATCMSAGCALASLGVFLTLSGFGSIYGLAELLLFPITFPRNTSALS